MTRPSPADIMPLVTVMARLRDPDTGCPWDIAQDFASIAPYTIEEAYEVMDAIERRDMEALRDELGDLLLQVAFHSRMAEQAGHFSLQDVIDGITRKMIRRHPHVFGEGARREDGHAQWEAIKAAERAEKEPDPSALAGVAMALPALLRAEKLQKRAARTGFDWPDADGVVAKIEEELAEVAAATTDAERTEEVGDLLFAVVNLARHLKVDPEAALRQAEQMLADGAAIIDVGGESTRPGAKPLWEGDEIKRVVPAIEACAGMGAAVSVDTRKAAVMEAALDAGAHLVNDVSGLAHDPRSVEVVAQAGCPVVLMHAPGAAHEDLHTGGAYTSVVFDVFDALRERRDAAVAVGIAREKILLDPGLGFGKSLTDNLALINALPLFHALGQPILFGASRKRMIGALSKEAAADARLGGSIALALKAMDAGAQLLRVHDVPETVQARDVWRGLRDAALTDFGDLPG